MYQKVSCIKHRLWTTFNPFEQFPFELSFLILPIWPARDKKNMTKMDTLISRCVELRPLKSIYKLQSLIWLTTTFWNSSRLVASVSHWELIVICVPFPLKVFTSLYNLRPKVSFPSNLSRDHHKYELFISIMLITYITPAVDLILPIWSPLSIFPNINFPESRKLILIFHRIVDVWHHIMLLS